MFFFLQVFFDSSLKVVGRNTETKLLTQFFHLELFFCPQPWKFQLILHIKLPKSRWFVTLNIMLNVPCLHNLRYKVRYCSEI